MCTRTSTRARFVTPIGEEEGGGLGEDVAKGRAVDVARNILQVCVYKKIDTVSQQRHNKREYTVYM